MKTLKNIGYLLALSLIMISCSQEDKDEFTKDLTEELQLKFLESDEIEKAFDFGDATFEKGDATQGKTESFSITPTKSTTEEKVTTFTFNTGENLDGIYTQLVTTNGTKSDRYFDIPATSLEKNGSEYSLDFSLASLSEEELKEVPVGEICLLFNAYKGSQDVSNGVTGCTTISIGEDGKKKFSETTFE